jgi:hypothetical protein
MHHPVEDEMTAFLGVFRGITTGAALLVSVLVATRFNARFGLMAGFLVLAVFDLLGFSALSVSSTFIAIVGFRFLHETWQSGVTRTAWFRGSHNSTLFHRCAGSRPACLSVVCACRSAWCSWVSRCW